MPESSSGPLGRIAGIDFGTVRIGIAISDAQRLDRQPLETYMRRGEAADRKLVSRSWWPTSRSRDSSSACRCISTAAKARNRPKPARSATGWPKSPACRSSTSTSDSRRTRPQLFLADASLSKKKRKARLDKLAAQIMLTAYLEKLRANPRRGRRAAARIG